MVRTPYCDKSGLRKGTWTPEEDKKLIAYVTRYGYWNWRQLPKFAGLSRCGKSCRLRWMNYLRPNLKRGNYSKEEDELIIKLHESLGNRWSAIAAQLPGRTDNEIKNHWHTSLKNSSKKKPNSGESKKRSKNNPHREKNRKRGKEDEKALAKSTNQEILESSQISAQPSSSSSAASDLLFSSNTPASDAQDYRDVVAQFDDCMPEIVTEYSGNFWTDPFLTDNYSTINYPPSPFTREVLLCSYDFYDDNINTLEW